MTGTPGSGFNRRFQSLGVPNFRVYFIGQSISLIGSFVQIVAQSWLVLKMTNSGTTLGVIVALQFLPLLVLGSWGGVLADRFDNQRLLLATSFVSLCCAAGLGTMVVAHRVTVIWVGVFAFALGMVGPFERPAAQAFLYELAGPGELANAVALNALLAPLSRLIGPAIAGVMIATIGTGACFFVNAISYVVVIGALLRLDRAAMFARRQSSRLKGQLREGFEYARRMPVIRATLIVLFVAGTMAYNFQTTVPAMTKFEFHEGATGLAFAQVLSAVGALIAGILVAGLRAPTVRHLALAGTVFGFLLVAWGFLPTFASWAIFGCAVGTVSTAFTTLTQSVLQRETEPAMLGRVMSLFSIGFFGTTPIGALISGALISALSPRWPFYVGGLATMVAAGAVLSTVTGKRGLQPGREPGRTGPHVGSLSASDSEGPVIAVPVSRAG